MMASQNQERNYFCRIISVFINMRFHKKFMKNYSYPANSDNIEEILNAKAGFEEYRNVKGFQPIVLKP
jgi:hypothetical protein